MVLGCLNLWALFKKNRISSSNHTPIRVRQRAFHIRRLWRNAIPIVACRDKKLYIDQRGCEHVLRPLDVIVKKSIKYEIAHELGFGAYGKVYKVKNIKDNKFYAMKMLSTDCAEEARKEFSLLIELERINREHGNDWSTIHHAHDYFNYKCHTFVVTELLDMDFYTYVNDIYSGDLPLSQCAVYLEQLCQALIFLQSPDLRIVHADIKQSNIMLRKTTMPNSKRQLVLIDFGISFFEGTCNHDWKIQTPGYRAPEVILQVSADCQIDIFSAGVVFYEVLCGRDLFYESNCEEALITMEQMFGRLGWFYSHYDLADVEKKLNHVRAFKYGGLCEPSSKPFRSFFTHVRCYTPKEALAIDLYKDLLVQMLEPIPTQRITAQDILNHKFMKAFSK